MSRERLRQRKKVDLAIMGKVETQLLSLLIGFSGIPLDVGFQLSAHKLFITPTLP